MFDDATDLYLTQPTFDGAALASNDFCPLLTSPASRRAKFRKRENGIQCPSSDTTSTSPATLSFPTPEEIEELLQTQNDVQKKWCSKRAVPGFSNIPVCQTGDPIYRKSAWNNELPPALRELGLLSNLFDIVGHVRKQIYFLEYTSFFSLSLSFSMLSFRGFAALSTSTDGLKRIVLTYSHDWSSPELSRSLPSPESMVLHGISSWKGWFRPQGPAVDETDGLGERVLVSSCRMRFLFQENQFSPPSQRYHGSQNQSVIHIWLFQSLCNSSNLDPQPTSRHVTSYWTTS